MLMIFRMELPVLWIQKNKISDDSTFQDIKHWEEYDKGSKTK